jgi:hypothetical protein
MVSRERGMSFCGGGHAWFTKRLFQNISIQRKSEEEMCTRPWFHDNIVQKRPISCDLASPGEADSEFTKATTDGSWRKLNLRVHTEINRDLRPPKTPSKRGKAPGEGVKRIDRESGDNNSTVSSRIDRESDRRSINRNQRMRRALKRGRMRVLIKSRIGIVWLDRCLWWVTGVCEIGVALRRKK